jgi:hypothetical protein
MEHYTAVSIARSAQNIQEFSAWIEFVSDYYNTVPVKYFQLPDQHSYFSPHSPQGTPLVIVFVME